MWFCNIINIIGFLAGIFQWTKVMYVCFGISFVAFFRVYAQIIWDFLYEREANLVDLGGRMNMVIANDISCILLLGSIYLMVLWKIGAMCLVLSTLQNMLFQLFRWKNHKVQEFPASLIAIVEFLLSFVFLF